MSGLLLGAYAPRAVSETPASTAHRAITGRSVNLTPSADTVVAVLRNIPAGSYVLLAKVRGFGGVLQCNLRGPLNNLQAQDGSGANQNISRGGSSFTLSMISTITYYEPGNADIVCRGDAPSDVAPARTTSASIIAMQVGSQRVSNGDPPSAPAPTSSTTTTTTTPTKTKPKHK